VGGISSKVRGWKNAKETEEEEKERGTYEDELLPVTFTRTKEKSEGPFL